jgi:hypothetical protein
VASFWVHSISFALIKAQKVVRGLWLGLSDKEAWPERQGALGRGLQGRRALKEHGDKWRLNEEIESPAVGAHSTPPSFREAHTRKKD